MAFRELITSQIQNAFELLGDLAVDVSLTQAAATGYNFTTGQAEINQMGTIVVRGILLTGQTIPGEETNRIADILILQSADVDDISKYATVAVGTRQFRIANFSNNGYTIECEVSGV